MIKTIDNDNDPIFVSFSGGETSGDMLIRVWDKYNGKRKIIVLFANTGQEDERTLVFVDMVSKYYGIPVVWLEAVINPKYGKGIRHKVVDFYSASRNHEVDTPMEQKIRKLGIPNAKNPDCTRDLKTRVMESWLKENVKGKFHTLVGIRRDEGIDRLKNKSVFYEPYHSGITKPKVNLAWENRPFRLAKSNNPNCEGLGLPGYLGNCRWCYKKSMRKLLTIAKEDVSVFDFPKRMEIEYEDYVHPKRMELLIKKNETVNFPIRFYRENISVDEIVKMAENFTDLANDDTQEFAYQTEMFFGVELDKPNGDCFDSCEPF